GLPGMQESLVNKVADAAKKPVILVLLCGGPVDVTFAKNNPKIGAIVWAGYPGQAGGIAIAQVLFGEHNPGWEAAGDMVPQGVHGGAHDGHADARRPVHGLPGTHLQVLQGQDRVQLRLRPELLQVLPPVRVQGHEAAVHERHRGPEGDGVGGGHGELRRGGDGRGGVRQAPVPGGGEGAEPRAHGREAPGAAVPPVAERDGRAAREPAHRVPERAPQGGGGRARGVRGEPLQALEQGRGGRPQGDRPGVALPQGGRRRV
uniref:Glycoside hydrolase family 3 C-terminal domain-containing protein n=1 Tax=Aegilops tauschii subsp. strangulata TaxID=200361 RepID=A0A453GLT7_AEGTS